MKRYGFNFTTEFTAKQINVIYGCAKRGELKIQKFVMSDLYDLANYYGTDSSRSVARSESYVIDILNDVFEKNYTSAQNRIDEYAEILFRSYSDKYQRSLDRTFVA